MKFSSAGRGYLRADAAALFPTSTSRWSNARWLATCFSRRLKTGFVLAEEIRDTPEFKIMHYRHKSLKE